MKLMFWQRIVAVIAFLVLIAAAIWFANRTRQATDAAISVDPAFAEYISAYTSGVVSSTSPLRVVFTRDMVDSSRLGSESDDRLFSFTPDRKSTRLNSSHVKISYAVFCLKKKTRKQQVV